MHMVGWGGGGCIKGKKIVHPLLWPISASNGPCKKISFLHAGNSCIQVKIETILRIDHPLQKSNSLPLKEAEHNLISNFYSHISHFLLLHAICQVTPWLLNKHMP